MQKNHLLTLVCILIFKLSFSQKQTIPAPSSTDASTRLKTDLQLHKLIKESTGYDYVKLTLIKTHDWQKFYTDEGDLRTHRWPEDGIDIAYDFETPKDKNGVSTVYQVFIRYRRSECSMNGCLMKDDYKFYKYLVGSGFQKGFKTFKGEEALTFAKVYISKHKPSSLDNFITIDKFEMSEGFEPENLSPTAQILRYTIVGKLAVYTPDRSAIIKVIDIKEDPIENNVLFYVSKKNNVWVGDSMIYKNRRNLMYYFENYTNDDILKEFYLSYKEIGFDGIYKKLSKADAPKGFYSKLKDRATALNTLLTNKIETITTEDIMPFVLPKKYRKESDTEVKEIILNQITVKPEYQWANIMTASSVSDGINYYYKRFNPEINLHTALVQIKGTVNNCKASKGKINKNKIISQQESSYVTRWLYDEETNDWYLAEPERFKLNYQ